MADYRENVWSLKTNVLFTENIDARYIRDAVDILQHNKLCNIQKSSCLQEFISKTHSYLSSSKDRVTGLILLEQLVQQCNTEIFHQHSPTWLRLLLQILQGHATKSVYRATCRIIGVILRFSKHFTDLSREIVSTMIPQLIPLLLNSSSEWRKAALSCITACLQTFPGTMVTFRNKIEVVAMNELEGYSCSTEAMECLCLLVQCGGGGNQGIKHTENWSELCDKLMGSMEETLSDLYEDIETDRKSAETRQILALKNIGPSQRNRLSLLVRRWQVLSECLQTLLGTEFHAVAKIPADFIIKLLCRCLSINRKMLLNRPTTERTNLALHLPSIHIAAMKVLKQLILTCKTLLVPYCHVVMGYISQELLWTHWSDNQGNDKPYGSLRSCTYEVLTMWLKVMDGCSGFLHEEKGIIKELLHDMTPQKETLKIDQTVSVVNGDAPPVKKKHKGGNYEVSQGISSQRKVHEDVNGKLVEKGLEALNWIVTSTGPELDRKCLQDIEEFSVKTLLLLHQSNTPVIPYCNPECRKQLYRVLLACVLTPHPTAPPPLQCAVSCLSFGLQDKDLEVSSFCREALRTCEALIHPRVPCLNGPSVCENLLYLGDRVPNYTGVSTPNITNMTNFQDENNHIQTAGSNFSKNPEEHQTSSPVSSITQFSTQKVQKNHNSSLENKDRNLRQPSVESNSDSLPDLDEGSNTCKRVRITIINDDDDDEPQHKYTKVKEAHSSRFGDRVESPQPSTSKTDAIEIVSDDSSSVEEIVSDVGVSHRVMEMFTDSHREEIVVGSVNSQGVNGEETGIDDTYQTEINGEVETQDNFITTDSDGQKEVLVAIPVTELSSDEEEIVQTVLQKKPRMISDEVKDKDSNPEVEAMLMTFVDADPDPE